MGPGQIIKNQINLDLIEIILFCLKINDLLRPPPMCGCMGGWVDGWLGGWVVGCMGVFICESMGRVRSYN